VSRAVPGALAGALLLVLGAAPALAAQSGSDAPPRQFTFSWSFADGDAMAPRGGTSRGPAVTLEPGPSAAWSRLQTPGLSPFERDRRAILAMAGPYRASFDFIETAGFDPEWTPARPYRSWGTEYVYVLEDRGDFVSLQHVLVMSVIPDGADEPIGPFVTKHWRQDWHYEADGYHAYRGEGVWERVELAPVERAGTWTQTVWQVDDSPRYASHGRWIHDGVRSAWTGAPTLRPLPRREFSVRDDYDVLGAVNRHLITPTGWIHEEHNDKRALDAGATRILAEELGLNRYERIVGHDFGPGDAYLERTGPFWALVREAWAGLFDRHERLVFRAGSPDGPLFGKLFEYADGIEAQRFDGDAARAFVRETLAAHVRPAED
jgi:hypothetical protein